MSKNLNFTLCPGRAKWSCAENRLKGKKFASHRSPRKMLEQTVAAAHRNKLHGGEERILKNLSPPKLGGRAGGQPLEIVLNA